MSLPNNLSKTQVQRLLASASFGLEKTSESWASIDEFVDLPEVLRVAIKGLPLLPILLTALASSLDIDESNNYRGKYEDLYRFAELCRRRVDYLNSIYDAVTLPDESTTKEEKYLAATEDYGEMTIEGVMMEVLQQAIRLASAFLTDEPLKSSLQTALDCQEWRRRRE